MPYATYTDAINQYGDNYVVLSSDRDDDGAVDATPWTKALEDASKFMDSYIGVRYDLPITVESTELRKFCIDIAVYYLCPEADVLTEEKRQRYEDALAWLRDLAKGTATLGQVDEPATHAGEVLIDVADRIFTRTSTKRLW